MTPSAPTTTALFCILVLPAEREASLYGPTFYWNAVSTVSDKKRATIQTHWPTPHSWSRLNHHHLRRLHNLVGRKIMHHVPGLGHDRHGGVRLHSDQNGQVISKPATFVTVASGGTVLRKVNLVRYKALNEGTL